MNETFNPEDRSSWYVGAMSRDEATDILNNEREGGVFLVRDSSSIRGDYVLCVKEDCKVSHYIINRVPKDNQIRYRIGDQFFDDLPSLIKFYKLHYLNTTPLIRPALRTSQTVIAKYDFNGNDPDDLPFRKGDVLTIVSKDEEQWWTAKNSQGKTGSIPVPYVQRYEGPMQVAELRETTIQTAPVIPVSENTTKKTTLQKKLPAFARVKQPRVPNAYDKTALKLDVGDIIKVTKTNINGQWEGELNGKVGHFPFTHVEFLNSDSNEGEEEI
ncbi:adapter molecule Crk [Planococcus citri]|uniref:adapter molecule Crk n=1 Tax=Planococcus citri TaxID=170843 RepID=UPI0031F9F4EE